MENNYKKIQTIIHDEIQRWSHIKPNSITNNIMKQLSDANLISSQPGKEAEEIEELPTRAEMEAYYLKETFLEKGGQKGFAQGYEWLMEKAIKIMAQKEHQIQFFHDAFLKKVHDYNKLETQFSQLKSTERK